MPEFLFQKIAEDVQKWRRNNYTHKDYSAISEILRFATLEDGSPRYLRSAQLIALETSGMLIGYTPLRDSKNSINYAFRILIVIKENKKKCL